MAVGCVGKGIELSRVNGVEYRALLVSSQQGGDHFGTEVILLREQLVIVLNDAPASGALNLGGQSPFAVKVLNSGLMKYCAAILTIQGIVVVAAKYAFSR
jgi:hypothetical protein